MAKRKAPKRKRAPGGGRKSAGDFSHLTAVTSLRMPADMRDELEKAAKARSRETGRRIGLSQELLRRLKESFDQDRKNYRDPATQALCFLFADLAENVHGGTPNWQSDPFLFKSFKLGVARLLDNLPEPAGKVESPLLLRAMLDQLSTDDPMNQKEFVRNERERISRKIKSPEALAEVAADTTLSNYFKPSQHYKDWEPWREELDADAEIPGLFSKLLRHQENTYYGMEQARNALSLKPRGRKS
jgi:hypothetical protein